MSRYCEVKCAFTDQQELVNALLETKTWTREQIEIHEVPQHLFGYRGDERSQVAHIIIRRKNVGSASNDIGFFRNPDGTFRAIISEYDSGRGYGEKFVASLKGNYAYLKIKKEQESKGREVLKTRCPKSGRQRIEISGYR